jgi:hypothetical protein
LAEGLPSVLIRERGLGVRGHSAQRRRGVAADELQARFAAVWMALVRDLEDAAEGLPILALEDGGIVV